jgi:hypothetical protein
MAVQYQKAVVSSILNDGGEYPIVIFAVEQEEGKTKNLFRELERGTRIPVKLGQEVIIEDGFRVTYKFDDKGQPAIPTINDCLKRRDATAASIESPKRRN